MNIRYPYNIGLALVAGFLVVATQAFAPTTVACLTFAIVTGATLAALGSIPARVGLFQRAPSGVTAVVGAWTIVATLVFAPTTVVWLGFASAVALLALAVAGLTAHELSTERVVHSIEVEERAASGAAAA
jgi:hypothetical protein